MVNLITGPKGSGKTQQMIELANGVAKTSNGNVVLIKRSHKDTYSVNFDVRAICMADYADIKTADEFIGFLYGMVAGNHDIETIFIDSILKQVDLTLATVPDFMERVKKVSADHKIDFYLSISATKEELSGVNMDGCKVLS